MKRTLVTGAAGFIGYHLAKYLKNHGQEVLGLDNFNDYYSVDLKKARAQELDELGCPIALVDLTDFQSLQKTIETFKPTHIVHLAAQAGVRYSLKNPQAYLDSNITGFTNLLEVLKDHPHIHTTYASSSSVYGNNSKVPFSENDTSDQPINLYGATKKSNELMAYAYHSLYQIPLFGLRFFTVYGPWGRPDMAYYLFSQAILEDRPIDVFEGKSIRRDFTYIDDIVQGIVATMNLKPGYNVFNLGNNNPVYLNDFISTIEDVLGKKAVYNLLPQAAGDMQVTYADLSKSQQLLNYQPTTDLHTGLQKFADWFKPYFLKTKKLAIQPQR